MKNLADVTVQITTLGIIVKVSALSTCGNLICLPMILCTGGGYSMHSPPESLPDSFCLQKHSVHVARYRHAKLSLNFNSQL